MWKIMLIKWLKFACKVGQWEEDRTGIPSGKESIAPVRCHLIFFTSVF
jgi:hypothetical protein